MLNKFSPVQLGITAALIASVLTAFSSPLTKLVLEDVTPFMSGAFLNLGAGLGVLLLAVITCRMPQVSKEKHLQRSDVPWVILMCVVEVLATVSMVWGLVLTTAANASLLNNFETVATAIFALLIFKEAVPRRLWVGIYLITAGCFLLSFQDFSSFTFSPGSILVILAGFFWGFENNITKKLSVSNPMEVVLCKGLGAGAVVLGLAFLMGEGLPSLLTILCVMAVGFLIYGLNIVFLVYSERHLGASKACTIYGINPFLGAIVSCIMFAEVPNILFMVASALMVLGFYFTVSHSPWKKFC